MTIAELKDKIKDLPDKMEVSIDVDIVKTPIRMLETIGTTSIKPSVVNNTFWLTAKFG